MIRNAEDVGEIDVNLFVVVDLINRIPREEVTDPVQRVLYAKMNEKAGKKALSVPDFSSAVKYSESGLAFLNSSHWKSHHNLMLSIHETSVVALYSFTNGNQDLLMERINTVFEHASKLDEEFRTRLVWIKLLSTTSLQAAIDECNTLLERMDEPIDSSDVEVSYVASELLRLKESILEEGHHLSSQMTDVNKIMAMKVMISLLNFYHHQRRLNVITVGLRMVEISLKFGCCEDSYFALAGFGVNLITLLGDIDKGVCWARKTLALLSKSRHNINAVMPALITAVYGFALWLVEPIQSTQDQLLKGIRLAFDYGNIAFAVNNTKVWLVDYLLYCQLLASPHLLLFASSAVYHTIFLLREEQ
jgi:ATP-dependent RNA helicase DDX31/DBP7